MLTLHTMPRIGWGLLSPSPFCAKVELYLKMIGEPYEVRPTLSTSAAPRQKLPWIEDGAERVSDSELILEHLQRSRGDKLGESALSTDQRQQHHLLRRTAEESLYFAIVAERWRDPQLYSAYTRDLLVSVPAIARPLVASMARRMLEKQLWQQGTGRFPLPEVLSRGGRDIEAIAWALGDQPFFGGTTPVGVDAAIWGAIANVWYIPMDTTLKRAVATHPNLVDWLGRVVETADQGVPVTVAGGERTSGSWSPPHT